jgi:uncharacterized membrane protein YhhN
LKVKDFAKIYFVILIAHLAAIDVGLDPLIERFTKPLLLFSLMAWFYSQTPTRSRAEKLFLVGLIFSWVGDIFLMFTDVAEIYFMLGLGAFLIAQANYALAFLVDARGRENLLKNKPWLSLPVLAYGGYFVWMLYPHLGALIIPVIGYAIVLVLMGVTALNRIPAVAPRSASLVLVGALLFIASDSILAYAKFVEPFVYHRILIMTTYGVAQFALVWGMLANRRKA